MHRREDEHIEAVALFPPTPSSLHEGSSSGLHQKRTQEKQNKTNHHKSKKPTTILKAKCQAPFPRAESHQQVAVGQFSCNLVVIYPQRCYQFFHVVEKLEQKGNGSLLCKALGRARASPLLQEVQLLVLKHLFLPSTDLGLSCPKEEIQKKTFGPAMMDSTWPRPSLSNYCST